MHFDDFRIRHLCLLLALALPLAGAGCYGGNSGEEDDPVILGDAGMDATGSETGTSNCSTGSTPEGKCNAGSQCRNDTDCASGVCSSGGVCLSASCSNDTQDGNETGPDCGGDCPACIGELCSKNSHCVSNYCKGGQCSAPSCTDKEKNGQETGVDCGGNCQKCTVGQNCRVNADCETGRCKDGTCAKLPASCSDGEKNGEETDADCGGPACGACPLDGRCNEDGDCLTGFCNFGVCKRPTCSDEIKNQGETDKDCGGDNCEACATGDSCNGNVDCQTNRCASGTCVSCSDGVQNGAETGADCGGPCDKCADGGGCKVDGDCQSGRCNDGFCATCSDGKQSGAETDVDCGGPCGACAGGKSCSANTDCRTGLCESGSCCIKNTETCDGQDNDCDGQVDEGCSCTNGQTQSCGQSTGTCTTGTQTCSGGRWGSCQGDTGPTSESCDGKDNDCDGVTDEGCSCDYRGKSTGVCTTAKIDNSGDCERPSDFEFTERSCDGKDNDCDGKLEPFCAPFAKVFGNQWDDYATDVERDSRGNIYVVGKTIFDLFGGNNNGVNDAFLVKFDRDGNRKWVTLFGTGGNDGAYGVALDSSGDIYMSGWTKSSFSSAGHRNRGETDYFVAKFDSRGNKQWVTADGTYKYDAAWDVTIGPGGDVYFSGNVGYNFDGQNHSRGDDMLVGRLDSSSGKQKWHRIFGGGGQDIGYAIDANSRDIFVGATVGHSDGSDAAFFFRYNSSGKQEKKWAITNGRNQELYDILVDGSHFYFTGMTEGTLSGSNSGRDDVYVAKYTTNGARRWLVQFGGSGNDMAYGLDVDDNGDVYVSGNWDSSSRSGDAFISRIDRSSGQVKWTKKGKSSPNEADGMNSVVAGDDHNVFGVGWSDGQFLGEKNAGKEDAVLWRVKKIK